MGIGQYDTMMAGLIAFIGFIISGIGIYFQLNYSKSPNSTILILNKSKNYMHSAEQFIQNEDAQKWDSVLLNAQFFIQRGTNILTESFTFIYGQINQQIERNSNNSE